MFAQYVSAIDVYATNLLSECMDFHVSDEIVKNDSSYVALETLLLELSNFLLDFHKDFSVHLPDSLALPLSELLEQSLSQHVTVSDYLSTAILAGGFTIALSRYDYFLVRPQALGNIVVSSGS